jgi:hypothetical protein
MRFCYNSYKQFKRAYKQVKDDNVLPFKVNTDKTVKPKQSRNSVSRKREDSINKENLDTEIRSHPQVLDVGSASSEDSDEDSSSYLQRRREDPEWTPGSSYLQRKLQGNDSADGIAYHLLSRLAIRSGRETEGDNVRVGAVSSPSSEHMITDTRNVTSPGKSVV